MAELHELIRRQADIERQITQLRAGARDGAIAEIRKIMNEHGLTGPDLVTNEKAPPKRKRDGAERKPVAVKYRDGQGNQWTGRGLKPKWLTTALIDGKALADFAV